MPRNSRSKRKRESPDWSSRDTKQARLVMQDSPVTPSPSVSNHRRPCRIAAGVSRILSREMAEAAGKGVGHTSNADCDSDTISSSQLKLLQKALGMLNDKISLLDQVPPGGRKKGYEKEFEYLQSETAKKLPQEGLHSYQSALQVINRDKNRYADVLPSEEYRVVLTGPHRDAAKGTDYINASHIMDFEDMALPQYIATQGPLDFTVADFWDMAKQERCVAVISLTRPAEGARVKCAHYFPMEMGEEECYAHLKIVNKGTKTIRPYIVERRIEVAEATDGETEETSTGRKVTETWHRSDIAPYTIRHYQYLEWPDHGVPTDTKSIRGLIRFLRESDIGDGPFLIHCSAGIGRTGTYIVVDHTIRKLLAGDLSALDIGARIRLYREQRLGMVQTKEQYRLCYLAVRDELQEIIASAKVVE